MSLRQRLPAMRPVGLMDKASASGAGDSRFESWAGHFPNSPVHMVRPHLPSGARLFARRNTPRPRAHERGQPTAKDHAERAARGHRTHAASFSGTSSTHAITASANRQARVTRSAKRGALYLAVVGSSLMAGAPSANPRAAANHMGPSGNHK